MFYVLLAIVIKNTKLGRYTYAIGSNEQGARQAGINIRFYKTLAYIICSMGAALGAIMFLGRAPPYAKSDYGMMWELDAIAAVVIGGTSLFGGRGSIWGSFLGVILLKLINSGLTLAQLETFWQMLVTGLIILVAVSIDIVRQNPSPKNIRQVLIAIATLIWSGISIHTGSPTEYDRMIRSKANSQTTTRFPVSVNSSTHSRPLAVAPGASILAYLVGP